MRLGGLPRPSPRDAVAGVSVALVVVPQALAYAQLAGMPPERGLYAAALPAIAAALFASSPYLQTGPTAQTSLLTFGALAPLAATGSDRIVQLALLLALVVGVTRLLVGLLRAGVIAYLMSQPMMLGFVPAAGILIVASQLPTALGARTSGRGVLEDAAEALVHPGRWSVAAIVLTLVSIGLIGLGPRLHRLFPAVLVAIAVGVAYVQLASYEGARVGAVSEGEPPLSLHLPWGELDHLLLPGVIIALVGFAEPSAIARTLAAKERRPWDANREFLSQGAANVAAAFSGGFPIGGSFSRSALNRLAGARTAWSGAATGIAVLAFLPFAGILSDVPKASLAGIVIGAVVGLVRLAPLARLRRYSLPQFGVALTTFALTLALSPHIERAVLIGIALAIAVHLWRELDLDVDAHVVNLTLHLRPSGVLWFGTAPRLDGIFLRLLADNPGIERLVLHLDGLGRVDLPGALALRQLLQDARDAGLEAELADVPPRAHRFVERVLLRDHDPLAQPREDG